MLIQPLQPLPLIIVKKIFNFYTLLLYVIHSTATFFNKGKVKVLKLFEKRSDLQSTKAVFRIEKSSAKTRLYNRLVQYKKLNNSKKNICFPKC